MIKIKIDPSTIKDGDTGSITLSPPYEIEFPPSKFKGGTYSFTINKDTFSYVYHNNIFYSIGTKLKL